MNAVAVIPARYASSRFPGKPLARETGKYLIQHVFERVGEASAVDRVVVATDHEAIAEAVQSFGGEVCLTSADHTTGTDRVAEVADRLDLADGEIVLNVQGDEPEIDPGALDALVAAMNADADVPIGTLAAPFAAEGPREGPGSPIDPNCVKVVVGQTGRALYFSRSLVPYPRRTAGRIEDPSNWLLHVGVYAFRRDVLGVVAGPAAEIQPSPLEGLESLEQLRWLSAGFAIRVVRIAVGFAGVDTPADYAAFVERTRSASLSST